MEACDVPYCFPPASSCPSSLDGNTNVSSISEELQAACPYHQCVAGSWEYELLNNNYKTVTRSEVKPDCSCIFEVWDCEFGSRDCNLGIMGTPESQDLKTANDCCVSKLADLSTSEASCECIIEPKCEAGDSTKCYDFAMYCCDENDQQCHCEYATKACRLALESDSEEVLAMTRDYCGGAEVACCGEDNHDHDKGLCTCDFWEPLCTDFSNAEIGDIMNEDATTCDHASTACCGVGNDHCKCDLFTHATEALDYKSESGSLEQACAEASNIVPNNETELQSLQSIYNETGGEYWLNNTGWTTKRDQCNWFGITCDEEDYVIEINLPNNNVTGEFPSNSLASFYKLQRLLLNNNELHGPMTGTYDRFPEEFYGPGGEEEWFIDASLFFNLRDLTHVDLSQNNLSGEVDILFAPALQYANFSHNNFTSINSFKKFKRSHQTLTICDMSHNPINTSTSDLMKNVPTNIEQFILSSNLIHGSLLTSSMGVLANLRRFDLSINSLSGELPDFSNSYPNLQVLDLSDQIGEGLVGNIPESLANLPFLSTLILASNQLSGSIPIVLGNMGQLRVLNLSNNKLSQTIPKELGKLGEFVHIICAFCRVSY